MTPLAAARIAGEVGLAGGTITGSAFAVKYSGEIKSANDDKSRAEQNASQRKSAAKSKSDSINTDINDVESKWNSLTQCVKNQNGTSSNCESFLTNFKTSLDQLKQKTQSGHNLPTTPVAA